MEIYALQCLLFSSNKSLELIMKTCLCLLCIVKLCWESFSFLKDKIASDLCDIFFQVVHNIELLRLHLGVVNAYVVMPTNTH